MGLLLSTDLYLLFQFVYINIGIAVGSWNDSERIRVKEVKQMQEINHTQYFEVPKEQEMEVKEIIASVYQALTEKGYNPVNQIVGYVMSGDPTYITSYNGARSLIAKAERDEIIEELLRDYIENNLK